MEFRRPNPLFWKPKVGQEMLMKSMRSRGPGGQHVNRTESAVQVFWNLELSEAFDEFQKNQLRVKFKSQLTLDGNLVFRVETERSLLRNKEMALEKLLSMIEKAFEIPKKRYKTKPTRSSIQRRMAAKGHRSQIKNLRKKDSM